MYAVRRLGLFRGHLGRAAESGVAYEFSAYWHSAGSSWSGVRVISVAHLSSTGESSQRCDNSGLNVGEYRAPHTQVKKESELSRQIKLAFDTGKSLKVLTLIKDSRKTGQPLQPEDCAAGLLCASKLAVGKNSSPPVLTFSDNYSPAALPSTVAPAMQPKWGSLTDLYNISKDLMNILYEHNNVSHEAYLAAMNICAEAKSPKSAVELMRKMQQTSDFGLDDSMHAEYVKALCSAVSPDAMIQSPRERSQYIKMGLDEYERYRSIQLDQGLKSLNDSVYVAAANAYAHMLGPTASSKGLIAVLKDMMEDGFEPRVKMCRSILSSALRFNDSELIHIMMEWFLVHFEYPMEEGVITAVMGYAEKVSDLSLARLAMKLREKSHIIRSSIEGAPPEGSIGYTVEGELVADTERDTIGANGVSVWDYASATMIAVQKKSTIAAVELLTEAEAMGLDILSIPLGVTVWERFVAICTSLRQLDALYFGLVDLAKQNSSIRIPRMALNTVIGASGRVGGIDRAFATFAEYDQVFGLTHDIHSFNALLLALSKYRSPTVISMIKIFNDMEARGIQPNDLSFTYLLNVMADKNDLSSLSSTLSIIRERNIRPRGRSLRRAAYAAVDLGQLDLLEELKAFMRTPLGTSSSGTSLPPSPLLYAFETTLKRKLQKIGKPIDKSSNEAETTLSVKENQLQSCQETEKTE